MQARHGAPALRLGQDEVCRRPQRRTAARLSPASRRWGRRRRRRRRHASRLRLLRLRRLRGVHPARPARWRCPCLPPPLRGGRRLVTPDAAQRQLCAVVAGPAALQPRRAAPLAGAPARRRSHAAGRACARCRRRAAVGGPHRGASRRARRRSGGGGGARQRRTTRDHGAARRVGCSPLDAAHARLRVRRGRDVCAPPPPRHRGRVGGRMHAAGGDRR
jgi:hypothetical protein